MCIRDRFAWVQTGKVMWRMQSRSEQSFKQDEEPAECSEQRDISLACGAALLDSHSWCILDFHCRMHDSYS